MAATDLLAAVVVMAVVEGTVVAMGGNKADLAHGRVLVAATIATEDTFAAKVCRRRFTMPGKGD